MFKPIKSLTVAITLVCSATSQSFEFYAGPIEGSFDSQLSLGSSWRMEEQNDRLLPDGDGNGDDGNANFSEGDTFSQIFKGSHDLQVNYQNYGGLIEAIVLLRRVDPIQKHLFLWTMLVKAVWMIQNSMICPNSKALQCSTHLFSVSLIFQVQR